jgi:GT2 family glycosyltransferase
MDKTRTRYPLVISVVLNNNHPEDTLKCLTSLTQNSYENQQIILLDNASNDGTVDAIRSLLPQVLIIELHRNLGYAGNNNIGIQAAMEQGAQWVFLLNEDTKLSINCISQLVSVGESDLSIGIMGPMVYHLSEPDVIQSAGGCMDKYYRGSHLCQNERDQGQYQLPHTVDWISGCSIMVRRDLIEQVGTLDERFFLYVEEFEWCVRAKRAGWQLVHVPQAKLWHKGVQPNYQPSPSVTYYVTRNRLLLLLKHHASPMAWLVTVCEFLRTIISWTIKTKWRTKREHRDAMWFGIVDFLNHRWGQMP